MQDFFGFLILILFVLLAVGIISPSKALFWFKGIKSRKKVLVVYGISLFAACIGFGLATPATNSNLKPIQTTESNKTKQNSKSDIKFNESGTTAYDANGNAVSQTQEETVAYTVLRSWKPNENPNAIGMDVLIEKNEVTEEKIKQLLSELITPSVKVANVLIFSSKNAWEESQKGTDFTDEYRKNYIAFYIKNNSQHGAYQGFNEIRWMQEEGSLASKYGQKTKL